MKTIKPIQAIALSFVAASLLVACDRSATNSVQPQTIAWELVTPDQLDAAATAQLALALEARTEMETTLKSNLLASIKADGPQGAVGVCSTMAPQIASDLATKHNLSIGRTSFKLRNPSNTPPAWMGFVIESRMPDSAIFTNNQGTLAVTYPIMIAPPCMLCHGEQSSLSQEVQASIAEHYPDDQATGFALNDLRGWFWVEVPKQ